MDTRRVCPILALLLLVANVAGCAPAQPRDPVGIVQAIYDRLNEGDLDGFMAYFAEDAVMIDDSGRYAGSPAIREHVQRDALQAHLRFELVDLGSDGNVATYSYKAYLGNTVIDAHSCVDVIADGRIIFDGTEELYRYQCQKDPSQTFCLGN